MQTGHIENLRVEMACENLTAIIGLAQEPVRLDGLEWGEAWGCNLVERAWAEPKRKRARKRAETVDIDCKDGADWRP